MIYKKSLLFLRKKKRQNRTYPPILVYIIRFFQTYKLVMHKHATAPGQQTIMWDDTFLELYPTFP